MYPCTDVFLAKSFLLSVLGGSVFSLENLLILLFSMFYTHVHYTLITIGMIKELSMLRNEEVSSHSHSTRFGCDMLFKIRGER